MWRSRLLFLLLLVMICGEVVLSRVSAKDCGGHAEKGQIGMSASYEIHGDTTAVTINWEGCSEEDMIVVNLDSKSTRNQPEPSLVHDTTELFGAVLLCSAGAPGSATFSYNHKEFVEHTRDPEQVLSVYLTERILVRLAGDVPGKGEKNVSGSTKLTSADCMDYFQILCSGWYGDMEKILFPNMSVLQRQIALEGRCSPFLRAESVTGFLYLNIAH